MVGYYAEIVKNYKSQSSADKSRLMTGFYSNGLVSLDRNLETVVFLLAKAITAIYGSVTSREEWHCRFVSALSASYSVHLSGSRVIITRSHLCSPGGSARLTSFRVVGETP